MLWVCVLLTTFACLIIIHHIHLSILNSIQQRHHIQFSSIYTYDKRDERRKEEKKIWNEQNRIDDTSKTVTMKHNASEFYSIQFNLSYYRKYNMTLHYIAWHDMIWYDVLSYDNNLIIEMMKNENNKILSLTLSGIKVQDPLKPPHTLHTCLISFQSIAYYYRTPSIPSQSSSSSLLSRHFATYLFISLNQTRIVIKIKKQILLIYNKYLIFNLIKTSQIKARQTEECSRVTSCVCVLVLVWHCDDLSDKISINLSNVIEVRVTQNDETKV